MNYLIILLLLILGVIPLHARVEWIVVHTLIVLVIIQVWRWVMAKVQDKLIGHFPQELEPMLVTLIKGLLFVILFIFFLASFGIKVTSLVAGMGLGGVAIAFALRGSLSDLSASLSLIVDNPFEVGELVILDDFAGKVELVGLMTTRLRSRSGEQLIIPNNDLLESPLRNFMRMKKRRALFTFRVPFHLSEDKLHQIPEIVQNIINDQELAAFNRAHFKQFGSSALLFEVVYFVASRELKVYHDVQQAINLAIIHQFSEKGIPLSLTNQKIYLNS